MTGGEITSLIVAAVLGGALSLLLFRRLRARAGAAAAIEADPDPVILISPRDIAVNRAAAALLGGEEFTSLAALGERIALEGEEGFPAWVARLTPGGDETAVTAAGSAGGLSVRLSAFQGRAGITVRLQDRGAEEDLRRELAVRTEERDRFRKILDGLPLPVWWRRPGDLKVAGANATYRRSVGLTDADDIEHTGRDMLTGLVPDDGTALAQRALNRAAQQSESHYVVIDGDRRLLDFVEQRLNDDGWTVGYGEDLTSLEAMQASVGESIAANDAVLEQLLTAIAVFGPDRRLNFYNRAFAELWGLEDNYLNAEPTFEEILDLLHDRRQMPETVDVRADIRTRVGHFTSLVETHEELLHLPDERSVRLSIVPHPMGGLLYQYEDVTDKLALERSFNTLTQVQQATLNNLYEGVAVFSRDGRMRLHNRAYREIWALSEEDLRGAPHIGQILDRIKPLMPDTGDWEKFRRENVVAVTEPRADVGRFELSDNRIIDYAEVPLPDGQCLLVYLDVSDSVRVQRVLEERNAALENADLLKSQFISNMSYELRTPLNTIVGFSEVLQDGIAGPPDRPAAGLCDACSDRVQAAGPDGGRYSRSGDDPGRVHAAGRTGCGYRRAGQRCDRRRAGGGGRQIGFPGCGIAAVGSRRRLRSGPDPSGSDQPSQQCGAVHARGRARLHPHRRRRAGPALRQRHHSGYRRRYFRRRPRQGVREFRAGLQRHAAIRRRAGARAVEKPGGTAWRKDRSVGRAGRRGPDHLPDPQEPPAVADAGSPVVGCPPRRFRPHRPGHVRATSPARCR